MTNGVKGTGRMSLVQTPDHTIKGWGHWWRTQEDLDAYKRDTQFKRRARKAGFYDGEYEEFRRLETQIGHGLEDIQKRERWVRHEMARLKAKHGLPKNANRQRLKTVAERTKDPELFALLNLMTTASMNDTEKLQRIRMLFLDNKPPAEILYQTALTVGINLRKKP